MVDVKKVKLTFHLLKVSGLRFKYKSFIGKRNCSGCDFLTDPPPEMNGKRCKKYKVWPAYSADDKDYVRCEECLGNIT